MHKIYTLLKYINLTYASLKNTYSPHPSSQTRSGIHAFLFSILKRDLFSAYFMDACSLIYNTWIPDLFASLSGKKNGEKTLSFCLFLISIPLHAHNFNITSIHDILPQRPDIEYIKINDVQPFEYAPFPIAVFPELQPNKGLFAQTFVAKIPNGQVSSFHGWIKIDNHIVSEFIMPYLSLTAQKHFLNNSRFDNVKKIKGRVVVLTLILDACYFHWLYNLLGRLALIEIAGIEYDWIYVSSDKPYMKETLALWGIDPAKIITPFGDTKYIQADELIVPSHVGVRTPQPHEYFVSWVPLEQFCNKWNLDYQKLAFPNNQIDTKVDILPANIPVDDCFLRWTPLCSSYFYPLVIDYLCHKFLPLIENKEYNLSEKVFISRKDSIFRVMFNEDEIFALFEPFGFKKYVLSDLSILEQIALFHNAQIIVAAHGSALINTIFCKPDTTIIEIFQGRYDACFYYLSDTLQLNHHCIKTMELQDIDGFQSNHVAPKIIQDFINQNASLFNTPSCSDLTRTPMF